MDYAVTNGLINFYQVVTLLATLSCLGSPIKNINYLLDRFLTSGELDGRNQHGPPPGCCWLICIS
jgi:hypothetical protein